MISGDELAEDVLVSIKIVCLTEGNREFGSIRAWPVVGCSKHASLVVSEREVLVGVVESEGSVVFGVKFAS